MRCSRVLCTVLLCPLTFMPAKAQNNVDAENQSVTAGLGRANLFVAFKQDFNIFNAKAGEPITLKLLVDRRAEDGTVLIPRGATLAGRISLAETANRSPTRVRFSMLIERADWSGGSLPLNAYLVSSCLLRTDLESNARGGRWTTTTYRTAINRVGQLRPNPTYGTVMTAGGEYIVRNDPSGHTLAQGVEFTGVVPSGSFVVLRNHPKTEPLAWVLNGSADEVDAPLFSEPTDQYIAILATQGTNDENLLLTLGNSFRTRAKAGPGIEKDRDYEAARHWYEQAARHHSPEAEGALASLLAEGKGGPPNVVRAYSCLNAAIKHGAKEFKEARGKLEGAMTPSQLETAKRDRCSLPDIGRK